MSEPNFHTYVPVGVTRAGRELFRAGVKAVIRKFADDERKHDWKDLFITCTEDDIQHGLRSHLEKGDPRDVIIYCLIMLYRGWRIRPSDKGEEQ